MNYSKRIVTIYSYSQRFYINFPEDWMIEFALYDNISLWVKVNSNYWKKTLSLRNKILKTLQFDEFICSRMKPGAVYRIGNWNPLKVISQNVFLKHFPRTFTFPEILHRSQLLPKLPSCSSQLNMFKHVWKMKLLWCK